MLLKSSEVAKELGVHKNTIIRMANDGKIPSYLLDNGHNDRGHYRFDLEEVKVALSTHRLDEEEE